MALIPPVVRRVYVVIRIFHKAAAGIKLFPANRNVVHRRVNLQNNLPARLPQRLQDPLSVAPAPQLRLDTEMLDVEESFCLPA